MGQRHVAEYILDSGIVRMMSLAALVRLAYLDNLPQRDGETTEAWSERLVDRMRSDVHLVAGFANAVATSQPPAAPPPTTPSADQA